MSKRSSDGGTSILEAGRQRSENLHRLDPGPGWSRSARMAIQAAFCGLSMGMKLISIRWLRLVAMRWSMEREWP
jgi:hypothetical protein